VRRRGGRRTSKGREAYVHTFIRETVERGIVGRSGTRGRAKVAGEEEGGLSHFIFLLKGRPCPSADSPSPHIFPSPYTYKAPHTDAGIDPSIESEETFNEERTSVSDE
jgi:hypothetical protein